MKTFIFILIGAWMVVIAIILIAYIMFLEHENEISRWRKDLHPGMQVYIDDGSVSYSATIVTVNEAGWISVINESGKTASHGNKCVYPLNEML